MEVLMHQDDSFFDDFANQAEILTEAGIMQVILFSQEGCSMCKFLEQQLIKNSIKFTMIDDIATIMQHHIYAIPTLLVNDNYFNYPEALQWVANYDNSR